MCTLPTEGQLMFKSTSEGEPRKHPSLYVQYEDESSSEGAMSPDQSEAGSATGVREILSPSPSLLEASTLTSITTPAAVIAPVPPPIAPTITAAISCVPDAAAPSPSLTSTTSSLSPLSSLASPQHPLLPSPQAPALTQTLFVTRTPLPHALTTPPLQNSAPGKDQSKNRKKSKGKSQPKARTIKFHEYKVNLWVLL